MILVMALCVSHTVAAMLYTTILVNCDVMRSNVVTFFWSGQPVAKVLQMEK